jgi:FkbM family methyltransferase
MNLIRKITDFVERISGVRIIRSRSLGLAYAEYELQQFLRHFEVDCVFDVGANAGQYATLLRERLRYQGLIISFEPIPTLAQVLREKARNDANWFVEELALDRQSGSARFNVMTNPVFSSLLEPSNIDSPFIGQNTIDDQIEVKTSTLRTEYLKFKERLNFRRPFLKMDTQGNDLTIAQSGNEHLKEFVGIQSELAIRNLYKGSAAYNKTLAFYADNGFELSALIPNNKRYSPDLIEIDCIMFQKSALSELPN